MMKLLYVHMYNAGPGIGGAARVALDLATAMKRDRGHEVKFVLHEGSLIRELEAAGIETFKISCSKWKTIETLQMLRSVVRQFRPDLVHSFHRYPSFLMANFMKRSCRQIYTEQVLRKDKKWLFRYGHLATACHESVRQNLINHYKVPEDRVLTVPNCVRTVIPNEDVLKRLRHQYGGDSGKVRILCTARLDKQKGHAFLLKALTLLAPADRSRLELYLAGEGELSETIKSQARQWHLEGQIHFLGYTRDISEWLALCDFFVLPSLYEGLSLALLEALNAGKPVLATDIPGNRGTVVPGQNGYLVQAASAESMAEGLQQFLQADKETLRRMGENAKKSAEPFQFKCMLQGYEEAYRRLLELPL